MEKAKMPSSKLIAKEFALGIVLEKKFNKDVSWVVFIEERTLINTPSD
jgi:hypothetical protein